MMKRTLSMVITATGLLAFSGCGASNIDTDAISSVAATITVSELRIVDQIEGWTENPDTYMEFTGSSLFALINGDAQQHIDRGLVEGIHQKLTSDTGRRVWLLAEDFGTPSNAKDMYTHMRDFVHDALELDGYDADVAAASANLDGAALYANLNRFYFELTFSNYGDHAELPEDIVTFLAKYESLAAE